MQFKGKLLLPDDTGPGLRVSLDVAAHHLAVESDDGGLGAWPLEVVDVERLEGDIFALTVAGEPLRFVAEDTIAFAYSGVPTIERVSRRMNRSRSTFRSMLDRIWNGPDKATETIPAAPTAEEEPPAELVFEQEPAEGVLVDEPSAPDVAERGHVAEALAEAAAVFEVDEATTAAPQVGPEVFEVDHDDLLEEWVQAEEPRCPAVRSDGRRCESSILTSSGYCYPHDPKRAFEDQYRAALEARAQLKKDATARLNRIYGRLDKAMRQVERGELDPETAMAMAQIANTMCAILGIDEQDLSERG